MEIFIIADVASTSLPTWHENRKIEKIAQKRAHIRLSQNGLKKCHKKGPTRKMAREANRAAQAPSQAA